MENTGAAPSFPACACCAAAEQTGLARTRRRVLDGEARKSPAPEDVMSRIVRLVALVLALGGAARGQDVQGVELCTREASMDRRTGCLQSNVQYLQSVIAKNAAEARQKFGAAAGENGALRGEVAGLKGEVASLKAALAAVQARVDKLEAAAKPAAKPEKPAEKPATPAAK
jgi:hypothetical protein